MKFTGTGVAVITPFKEDKTIDIQAIHTITEHLIMGGVEYLVVLGSTGEAATLNLEEKQLVLETYLAANKGRLPIVVGAGGNDTREVCQNAAFFQQNYPTLSGILSVSPFYNKPSQEGIYQHYKAISETSSLPVILYNVPGRTGSNMSADTTLRLAHDLKNVVAMKEASGNLEQMMAIIKDRPAGFQVISGDDPLTLPLVAAGGDGVISVVAHAVPRQFSDMVRASLAGDFEKARELHYAIFQWYGLAFAEGNPTSIKTIMALQDLCENHVRLPLVEGSKAFSDKVLSYLSQLQK